jgi:acetylornithine deacetylase/succinyl-diaminopimelate desuccinylase-like protein
VQRHVDSQSFCDITVRCLSVARPAHTPVSDRFVATLGLPTTDMGIGYPGARIDAPDEIIRIEDLQQGAKATAALLQRFAGG